MAPASAWARFAEDWEQLLPFGTIAKNGKHHFKMSEMAASGLWENFRAFYNVIENYPEMVPISCRMNLVDFRRAQDRILDLGKAIGMTIDLGTWTNPYYFTFRLLLDVFHIRADLVKPFLPEGKTVDFIFDDRSEKRFILAAWDEISQKMAPEINLALGSTPRFENDQKFLQLQAADLWAWWVREWYEEDSISTPPKMNQLDFGTWPGKRRMKLVMAIEEDGIFDLLRAVVIDNIADGNMDPIAVSKFHGEI
jgi:hypothetical protein